MPSDDHKFINKSDNAQTIDEIPIAILGKKVKA